MKNQNIDKALEKAISNLSKLDNEAVSILAKQKSAKAEVARLTMVKYGKPFFDLTATLDQKGIEYNVEDVKAAFENNNFLLLHELSLKVRDASDINDSGDKPICDSDSE